MYSTLFEIATDVGVFTWINGDEKLRVIDEKKQQIVALIIL